nr:mucin-2-like [Penaeus vannamei]
MVGGKVCYGAMLIDMICYGGWYNVFRCYGDTTVCYSVLYDVLEMFRYCGRSSLLALLLRAILSLIYCEDKIHCSLMLGLRMRFVPSFKKFAPVKKITKSNFEKRTFSVPLLIRHNFFESLPLKENVSYETPTLPHPASDTQPPSVLYTPCSTPTTHGTHAPHPPTTHPPLHTLYTAPHPPPTAPTLPHPPHDPPAPPYSLHRAPHPPPRHPRFLTRPTTPALHTLYTVLLTHHHGTHASSPPHDPPAPSILSTPCSSPTTHGTTLPHPPHPHPPSILSTPCSSPTTHGTHASSPAPHPPALHTLYTLLTHHPRHHASSPAPQPTRPPYSLHRAPHPPPTAPTLPHPPHTHRPSILSTPCSSPTTHGTTLLTAPHPPALHTLYTVLLTHNPRHPRILTRPTTHPPHTLHPLLTHHPRHPRLTRPTPTRPSILSTPCSSPTTHGTHASSPAHPTRPSILSYTVLHTHHPRHPRFLTRPTTHPPLHTLYTVLLTHHPRHPRFLTRPTTHPPPKVSRVHHQS